RASTRRSALDVAPVDVHESLGHYGLPSSDLAPTGLVVLRDELQRLRIERNRPLLRPAASRLFGRGDEMVDGALGLACLSPVVAEGLVCLAHRGGLFEVAGDGFVTGPPGCAGKRPVRDLVD